MENPTTLSINESIILKQVEAKDAIDIFNTIHSQREYLGKWLPFVHFTLTIYDTQSFIASITDTLPEKREYVFVIHYKNVFVGLIGFKDTDKLNQKTEIGYWLSEKYQKQGIMTKSVKALIQFAFIELNMNRVQIKCAVGNVQSKNIPQRLGFQFEGIERAGELLSDGKFQDIEIYSKLKNE